MKKKTIAIALTVAIVVIAAIGATYAYFTAQKEATNTFTVGKVDISLDGITDTTSFNNLYPSQTITSVQPSITNTGSNDAYVRLIVTINYDGTKWPAALTEANTADSSIPTAFDSFARTKLLNINTTDWTHASTASVGTSQFIYVYNYNKVLGTTDATKTTSKLFDTISISQAFGNALSDVGTFSIKVKAQAIQADGFTGPTAQADAFTALNAAIA